MQEIDASMFEDKLHSLKCWFEFFRPFYFFHCHYIFPRIMIMINDLENTSLNDRFGSLESCEGCNLELRFEQNM